MREELDNKLCAKYPKIFRDRNAPMNQTCMCWGFEHDDGWYNIIDMMCANIQHHIDHTRRNRLNALLYNRALGRAIKGDLSTYNKLSVWQRNQIDDDLKDPEPQLRHVPEACTQVVAMQVKEKFGTLRFYYSGGDDIVGGIERMADSMSAVMCEECGAPGRSRRGGWIRTLCDTHAEEQGYYTTEAEEANLP
jgi:hypothetical protein